MGVIQSFFNKNSLILRKVAGTGNNSELFEYQIIYSNIICCVRPLDREAQNYDESVYGYEFNYYCNPTVDIRVDDIVRIEGVDYTVNAVNFFEDEEDGAENHKRATIRKSNTNTDPVN